jgi:nitroreductase
MSAPPLLSRTDLLALVDDARRAPSVHNIQPARWALSAPDVLTLRADSARRLPIADPTGHDVRVSLGAACEGMAIALGARGLIAAPPHLDAGPPFAAQLRLERGGTADPLAPAVARRATWRGTFARTPATALDALERRVTPAGVVVVRDARRTRELAALSDEAGDEFLLDPRYWRETWQWLRLAPSHPGWTRDGLNADALALSGVERVAGRWLMAPRAFEWMRRLGLARALISERGKVESAGALLLFTAPVNEDPFVTGRAFYRRWLEATMEGLALCPMSVLADSRRANDEIRRVHALPASVRLVNVFRVGAPPPGFPGHLTPRLPSDELIVAA